MQLVNEFVVPRGIDEAWAVLTDIERIAPALPGAHLDGVTDGEYQGTVKVKVGPVTARYSGVATFRELDEANHHAVLEAKGKEASGRGRASALVTADLTPEGGDTRVRVTTDLTISGPLAQFGRGAIAEVSTKMLNQFADNLQASVLAAPPGSATTPSPPAAPSVGTPAPEGRETTQGRETTEGASAADQASGGETPQGEAEVNLLRVAAWPVLKRLIPVLVVVAVVVVLLVWWLA